MSKQNIYCHCQRSISVGLAAKTYRQLQLLAVDATVLTWDLRWTYHWRPVTWLETWL